MSKKVKTVAPKIDHVEVAINELIAENNPILIAKNDILKEQILEFNTSILNVNEKEVNIIDYISKFKNKLYPNMDNSHVGYFLKLQREPTFVSVDDLGPQKFKILALEGTKRNITTKQIQLLLDQYEFKENEDYFKRPDVKAIGVKAPRTIYVLTPCCLKTCLIGSKLLGQQYRECYFFIEVAINAYTEYQGMYALENTKSIIKRLEESNLRLQESNARIEAKLNN